MKMFLWHSCDTSVTYYLNDPCTCTVIIFPKKMTTKMWMKIRMKFSGEMTRNITCLWGGRTCLGYTNKMEKENYCDHPDVGTNTFCASGSTQSYESYVMPNNTQQRKFKWEPATVINCLLITFKLKRFLRKCTNVIIQPAKPNLTWKYKTNCPRHERPLPPWGT